MDELTCLFVYIGIVLSSFILLLGVRKICIIVEFNKLRNIYTELLNDFQDELSEEIEKANNPGNFKSIEDYNKVIDNINTLKSYIKDFKDGIVSINSGHDPKTIDQFKPLSFYS